MKPDELRAALDELDLSITECARKLDVTRSSVQRWLKGTRPITGPVQAAIEAWLREARLRRFLEEKPKQ